jgi:hypothetical protein
MRGEVLNFWGGLLVFLAALVPTVRHLWKRVSTLGLHRLIAALVLQLGGGAVLLVALVGSKVGIHLSPEGDMALLAITLVLYPIAFVVDSTAVSRLDVAVLTLQISVVAVLLAMYIAVAAIRTQILPTALRPAPDSSPTLNASPGS